MQRIISYQPQPGVPIIGERLPQTLTVVGTAYLVGVLIALPIGIYSAYRQYSAGSTRSAPFVDDRLFGAHLLYRHVLF
jgi:ABC-type dipeptide/oligopeptide/nickel transport system permease component